MWDIGAIFHEKQEGRLCAQHCLNATLQGSYFTAVDLSELAMRLDEEERQQMTESENGVESDDYKRFLQQPSGNMDDTGFFSVQVISQALALWNLELIPLNSTDEYPTQIRANPTKAQAFIFNMESHWFCIRRFNSPSAKSSPVFFNLNSLLSKPEYMSNLYLTEYLKQMQKEGYSVFVVKGELPECPADSNPPLQLQNADHSKPTQFIDLSKSDSTVSTSENDEDLQRAIEMSLSCSRQTMPTCNDALKSTSLAEPSGSGNYGSSDSDLETALRLSLECFGGQELNSECQPSTSLAQEQLRDKRLAYFSSLSSEDK